TPNHPWVLTLWLPRESFKRSPCSVNHRGRGVAARQPGSLCVLPAWRSWSTSGAHQ
ncbi:unnamed protein product, partial [Ectocarpus sp. 12 AP-2014]